MTKDEPPFRFQGGDAVDGFPTVDGTKLTWIIQFELGEGWRDLGILFESKAEADEAIAQIRKSMDINLRSAVKETP
jgi:hypothetical protein